MTVDLECVSRPVLQATPLQANNQGATPLQLIAKPYQNHRQIRTEDPNGACGKYCEIATDSF